MPPSLEPRVVRDELKPPLFRSMHIRRVIEAYPLLYREAEDRACRPSCDTASTSMCLESFSAKRSSEAAPAFLL